MFSPLLITSQNFAKIVIPLIEQAVKSIDIMIFEWRFYDSSPSHPVSLFNKAIIDAKARGVPVRVIANSKRPLLALKRYGIEIKDLHTKKVIHSKLMILDGRYVIIGSHNYTEKAFCSNYECSIFCDLSVAENDFTRYFNNLWKT